MLLLWEESPQLQRVASLISTFQGRVSMAPGGVSLALVWVSMILRWSHSSGWVFQNVGENQPSWRRMPHVFRNYRLYLPFTELVLQQNQEVWLLKISSNIVLGHFWPELTCFAWAHDIVLECVIELQIVANKKPVYPLFRKTYRIYFGWWVRDKEASENSYPKRWPRRLDHDWAVTSFL
jgi:hypothetical protein